jgi:hypothetical protein
MIVRTTGIVRRVEFRRLVELPAPSQLRVAAAVMRQLGRAADQLTADQREQIVRMLREVAVDLETAGVPTRH